MRLLKFLVISFLLFIITNDVSGQSAGSKIWYFGYNAGVSFTTTPPSALTDGKIYTDEGCAAVSDANGKLYFYTDGKTVYDRQHNVMGNGSNLNGDPSSTQSAVTVGDPGNPNNYYLFTVDAFAGTKGLCYSIIDMTKAGGLGSVTTKNKLLRTPVSEKITAVRRANSTGVWIISRGWNNDSFHVFLLDSFGCKFYKSQSIGTTITGGTSNTVGYLKSNIQGTKVAYATYQGFVELFDFDAVSATFSNTIKFTGLANPYGVEFSKSGKFLYYGSSSSKKIWQVDVTLSTPAAVLASATAVVTISGNAAFALQLGPDEKIYMAIPSSDYLSCIPNPEVQGTGCGYVQKAIDLNGKLGRAGLPNALNSDLFLPYTNFTYQNQCANKPVLFDDTMDFKYDSVRWYFGVKGSSYLGSSNKNNPSFFFPKSDSYNVKLVVYIKKIRVDSVTKKVVIPNSIIDSVYTTFCQGDSFKIRNKHYKTGGIIADTLFSYKGCDSIVRYFLTVIPNSIFKINASICSGQTYNFRGTFISSPGIYTQKIKNYLNCDSIIELNLSVKNASSIQLKDSFCQNATYNFNGQTLTKGGNYEARFVNSAGCDSVIYLNLKQLPAAIYPLNDTFCLKDTYVFYGKIITKPGVYLKTFPRVSNCDSTVKLNLAMRICYPIVPCILEFPEAFTPDENKINDVFAPVVSCNILEYELKIYNRWGETLFQSKDPSVGWDGKVKGDVVQDGMYAYRVNYTAQQGIDPEKGVYQGMVMVMK